MYDLFFFRRLFFSIIRLNFFPAVWHYRKYRYSFSFIWWAIRFASYIKWKWHKKLTKPILKPFNDSYSPIITRYKQNVNYHMLIIYLDSVSLQVANSVFFSFFLHFGGNEYTAWHKLSILTIVNLSLYVSRNVSVCCGVRFTMISFRLACNSVYSEKGKQKAPFLTHFTCWSFTLCINCVFLYFGKIRLPW